jgi:hypothetical protein
LPSVDSSAVKNSGEFKKGKYILEEFDSYIADNGLNIFSDYLNRSW